MDIETCYANIKRELLAIIYGCEKFHTYLYGRTLIMETDHKPLKMISLKNLTAAPAHLQRMLLCLQQCDLVITQGQARAGEGGENASGGCPSAVSPSRVNTKIQLDLWVDAISMFAFTPRHPDQYQCRDTMGTPSSQWCTDSAWMVGLTDKTMSPEQQDFTGASMTNSQSMETSWSRVNEW